MQGNNKKAILRAWCSVWFGFSAHSQLCIGSHATHVKLFPNCMIILHLINWDFPPPQAACNWEQKGPQPMARQETQAGQLEHLAPETTRWWKANERILLTETRTTGFWWCQMILVSVSKIPSFAFLHVVLSGVSCYSCLWLEIVPPVILLASVSTPGSPTLSGVSVVRALSAG